MAAIDLTVSGVLYDKLSRTTRPVVLIGEASLTGLGVGGGPIYPPGGPPPIDPGLHPEHPIYIPGHPEHPIYYPPGSGPHPEHPIVLPPCPEEPPAQPSEPKPPPPDGGWGWSPSYGWGWFPGPGQAGPKK